MLLFLIEQYLFKQLRPAFLPNQQKQEGALNPPRKFRRGTCEAALRATWVVRGRSLPTRAWPARYESFEPPAQTPPANAWGGTGTWSTLEGSTLFDGPKGAWATSTFLTWTTQDSRTSRVRLSLRASEMVSLWMYEATAVGILVNLSL